MNNIVKLVGFIYKQLFGKPQTKLPVYKLNGQLFYLNEHGERIAVLQNEITF